MAKTRTSRRRFLAITGGALGASALACCGLAALANRQPESEVEFVTSTYGEENSMNERILVAYASRHGAIGEVLAQGRRPSTCAACRRSRTSAPTAAHLERGKQEAKAWQ